MSFREERNFRVAVAMHESKKMKNHKEIKAEGGVFYWSLGNDSHYEILESGLRAIGLTHLIPERNTLSAALKSALTKFCCSSKTSITSVGNGYQVTELVQSEMNETRYVDHKPAFVVFPPPNGGSHLILKDPNTGNQVSEESLKKITDLTFIDKSNKKDMVPPEHATLHAVLCREYSRQLRVVPASKVARVLVGVVRSSLGVSLRDTGGIYWVSNDHLNLWNQVRIVIESASESNKVYALHTIIDESLCSAVCDALTNNVMAELTKIEKEIEGGFKQERALKARQQRASELRDKVKEYSSILGVAMNALEERVEKTDTLAAFATLAAL